jgi:hypothetical protein
MVYSRETFVGPIFRRLLAPRDPARGHIPVRFILTDQIRLAYWLGLADGLIQVVEEGVERAFSDTLADGIINNGDRAFEIRVRVIAQ